MLKNGPFFVHFMGMSGKRRLETAAKVAKKRLSFLASKSKT